ncbi:PP2C family protein-serine/threonine phosphatase [Sphingomonas sp.]|jgi:serine/threonine protein phosphatase PrpC|uniref:PP2C family protein-serine/threonine phosphatase n=1 Tax=Sphingomonas sp. TaxID=28214 RepID=UPI002ED91B03
MVTLRALLRRVASAPPTPSAPVAATSPRSAARTHVGRVRTINEDRVLDRPGRRLWAVADGMGGLSAGDVAADLAVATLDALASVTEAALLEALQHANTEILAAGGGRSGTTIVAAHIAGDLLTVFWAGDSRAYHVRGTRVRKLTRDHSVVQDLIDAGLLDEDKADGHPRSNVVTRALGVVAPVAIDTVRVTLEPGDRVMLCSDGVSRSLILRDLARGGALNALADTLLTGAIERDGSDNASLVLIEV